MENEGILVYRTHPPTIIRHEFVTSKCGDNHDDIGDNYNDHNDDNNRKKNGCNYNIDSGHYYDQYG